MACGKRLAVLVLGCSCLHSLCAALRHAPLQTGLNKQVAYAKQAYRHRSLQSTASGVALAQNITVNANGFEETYRFHATTTLVGYDLPPVRGSCSLNSQLDPAVEECAKGRELCCFDASDVKVGTERPCISITIRTSCSRHAVKALANLHKHAPKVVSCWHVLLSVLISVF